MESNSKTEQARPLIDVGQRGQEGVKGKAHLRQREPAEKKRGLLGSKGARRRKDKKRQEKTRNDWKRQKKRRKEGLLWVKRSNTPQLCPRKIYATGGKAYLASFRPLLKSIPSFQTSWSCCMALFFYNTR